MEICWTTIKSSVEKLKIGSATFDMQSQRLEHILVVSVF